MIHQPEFRVPVGKALPGMVLSRNLEHNGQLLLRHGIELDQERIEKLNSLGVTHLHIHFSNDDLRTYKELLVQQDSPPSYERLLQLSRGSLLELVPPFARPYCCARTEEAASLVNATVDHTLDVIFSSRRCFELLRTCQLFQLEPLKHCPVAWIFALCTGVGLGYNPPTLLDLSLSSLFYDIGMLKVPPQILAKPSRLTDLEFGEIKKHVFFGRRLLADLSAFSSSALTVAFEHHEYYYGGGYPKNKRGDAIHEFSQIVGLTDKFAAMVTARSYRKTFQPYEAYEMLLAQTKSAVSPRVFVAFLKSVLLYPRGAMLRLSNGEIAVPVDFPLHLPTRPTVEVTHSSGGEEVVAPRRQVHLADHPELTIESFAIAEQPRRTAAAPEQQVPGIVE